MGSCPGNGCHTALPTLPAMPTAPTERPKGATPRSLSGLVPFLRPYRGRILLALLFLVLAAVATLVLPAALKSLIDQGLVAAEPGDRLMSLREHFGALFAVGAALGLFSAARFYMVTWLGERITADLRNAVYSHVVQQSPAFFETTATGEVLEQLDLPAGAGVSGLEADRGDRFYCGGGPSGKVRAVRRPR